jgi:thiamine biosynthesis lipoprotein
MPPRHGLVLAARYDGVEACITTAEGALFKTPGWERLDVTKEIPALIRPAAWTQAAQADTPSPKVGPTGWVSDWALQVFFQAPPKDLPGRPQGYREPYMVMWISDRQNHPIRTLVMVGKDAEYQKDNYIWWSLYGERAAKLVEVRSTGTALSGSYPTFWPGYTDSYEFLAAGNYLLNIEASREKGQHTFRSIPISLGTKPFQYDVPPSADMGSLTLVYGKQP